jgi:hypothetical protein
MKRRLALAIGVLALLGGGTAVALAAAGAGSPGHKGHRRSGPHGVLSAAAGYLGVSVQQLRHDLRSGRSLGEVANATPGHSEAGLIQALLAARRSRLRQLEARLPERLAALVEQTRGHSRAKPHPVRQAVLSYLGLTAKQLQAELRSGRTLAQVADATPGKSADGLAAAVLGARQAQLDEAAHSGSITSEQAAARKAKLAGRVHAMIAGQARGASGAGAAR